METNDLIRKALARAGGKQSNLASAVSVHKSEVSRWLTGERQPSDRAYRALLKYVGVPLTEVRILVDQRVAAGGG